MISDAGCACVADPGADIVSMAHANKIAVMPFVGPSSILLSLMGSGFQVKNSLFTVTYLKTVKNVFKH